MSSRDFRIIYDVTVNAKFLAKTSSVLVTTFYSIVRVA